MNKREKLTATIGAGGANLLMDGILDKAGLIPPAGNDVCFEMAICGERQ